jgi:hypothetical protein
MIVDKIVLRYNVMSAFPAASRIVDFFRAHCVSFDAMTILLGSQQQQQQQQHTSAQDFCNKRKS